MKVVTKEEEEEEEEEEADEKKKKTVVVGVKLDTQSRELLTWALFNLVVSGDRLIALHVVLSSNDEPGFDAKAPNLLSLMKDFDAMLAVYEGFCNLKQIDLKLKICRGASIRKALVQEAQCFGAAKLVIGVAKNSRGIGASSSSTSIAKYCARKMACDCSVLAVCNGKIIFQKAALEMSKTVRHNEKPNQHKRTDSECSFASKSDVVINSNALYWSSHGSEFFDSMSQSSCGTVEVDENSSVCSPESVSKEVRPRWKLVRNAVLNDKLTSSKVGPKNSMIRWAMRLSNRYSAFPVVYSDQKHIKLKIDSTSASDNETRSVVSVETDSSHSSDKIENVICELPKELESLQEEYSLVCRLFDLKELIQMTSNFSQEKLIGKGGSSRVYKGCLSDGRELAVKILKPSSDALRAFVSEIEIITSLNHKNIISLFGFCFENNKLILVYDFLSRGSLDEVLHGEKGESNALSWVNRYKVAIGVAEALDYLHCGSNSQPVIHRDVKSSNILLSDDFQPKLADFGLARWASSSSLNLTCGDVAGTFGYLAPEYFIYGKVNEKIDVYAFGVVLLELLSGRRPIRTGCPKGEESLVMWAKRILNDLEKAEELLDPCLGDEYDIDQMERMALAASLCIRRASRCRPQVATVLKLLQGDDEIVKWARLEAKNSEEIDGVDNEEHKQDSDIKSHLTLALLDVEDASLSTNSTEQTFSDECLQEMCSRSSSFV